MWVKLRSRVYLEEVPGGPAGGGGGGAPPPAGGTPPPVAPAAGDFRTQLSDEYKSHPSLMDVKDLNGLVKSYINAQSMVGADKIVLPRPDAGPEEWDALYTRLGRPSDPSKYDLSKTKIPDGFPMLPDAEKFARELFQKAGLNNQQAAAIYDTFLQREVSNFQAYTEERAAAKEKAQESLKGEWKQDFEKNMAMSKLAQDTFGGQELQQWLMETGLDGDPMLSKIFAKVGQLMSEDPLFKANTLNNGFASSADQAQGEIARLQTDAEFQKMYMNRDHPQHSSAKQRMDNLYKQAYPGQMSLG